MIEWIALISPTEAFFISLIVSVIIVISIADEEFRRWR